jgi:transcriptional regulator with XRE-family HTH domain
MELMEDIRVEQIKAARALLNWTQKDLAVQANLNKAIIANYESGRNHALNIKRAIYSALTSKGIKFVDGGVLPQHVSTKLTESFLDVLNDVENTLGVGDIFYRHNFDEKYLSNEEVRKIQQIEANGIKQYITTSKSVDFEPVLNKEHYRISPNSCFSASYNTMALSVENNQRLVITSKRLAIMFKNQFEYWWKNGKETN